MRRKVTLKYLLFDKNRHGKRRLYVRVPGRKLIRLPVDSPEDPGFSEAYAAALMGVSKVEKPIPHTPTDPATKMIPGSLRELCSAYFAHISKDKSLAERTKYIRKRHLDDVCQSARVPGKDERPIGDVPVKLLTTAHMQKLLDRKADTPEAANDRRKVLNRMFKWGIVRDFVKSNPMAETESFKTKSEGHATWTWEHVQRYAERHPFGTKAYLALALFLFTGQRLGDVIRLGRQHVKDGALEFKQQKGGPKGKEMRIPIIPALQQALDTVPSDQMQFIVTEFGKPFTPAGFGNWFRDRVEEAGLKPFKLSAHGLRKGLLTMAPKFQVDAFELMAIAGHSSLKETTRYTKKYDRDAKSVTGMAKLNNLQIVAPGIGLSEGATKQVKKTKKIKGV